jgi:hypothetical protein
MAASRRGRCRPGPGDPGLQPIFKTQALSVLDLAIIMAFSSLPLWIMEAVKAVTKKFRIYEAA